MSSRPSLMKSCFVDAETAATKEDSSGFAGALIVTLVVFGEQGVELHVDQFSERVAMTLACRQQRLRFF
jgi:hypothetical protein